VIQHGDLVEPTMPILVNCPACQRTLRVPDTLLDRHVRCPSCEATFIATREMAVAEPAMMEPEIQAGPERAATPQPEQIPPRPEPAAQSGQFAARSLVKPHRGVLILVLGILSIVLGCVGVILGPIAWLMGDADLREIREGHMDREGEGLTSAGRICGIIGTCIGALSCCCCGPGTYMQIGHPRRFRF